MFPYSVECARILFSIVICIVPLIDLIMTFFGYEQWLDTSRSYFVYLNK